MIFLTTRMKIIYLHGGQWLYETQCKVTISVSCVYMRAKNMSFTSLLLYTAVIYVLFCLDTYL